VEKTSTPRRTHHVVTYLVGRKSQKRLKVEGEKKRRTLSGKGKKNVVKKPALGAQAKKTHERTNRGEQKKMEGGPTGKKKN